MTRVFTFSIVLSVTGALASWQTVADAKRPRAGGAPIGLWQCSLQRKIVHLAVLPGGVLSFDGAGAKYKISGSRLQVADGGSWVNYPFQLSGRGAKQRLTIKMPGGQQLGCKPLGNGKENQLKGMLCSYSGSSSSYSGTSSSSSNRVFFDGKGQFSTRHEGSFSGPSGQFYSGGSKEHGFYRVVGNRIFLVFADGSGAIAKVHMRQNNGRITEANYQGTLFAAGLCQ